VDDDPCVREALRLLIDSAGWRALTFTSAEEFLGWSRVPVPSCVVLDVALPDLSGLELQTLLAEEPDLPVIFAASVADISMIVRAMKAGAVEFLMKPFADEAL
jgi:FixJ family two-component response regulator